MLARWQKRRHWFVLCAVLCAVVVLVVARGRVNLQPGEHSAGYHLDPTDLGALEAGEIGDGVRVLCYHYFRRNLDPVYLLRVVGAVVLGAPTLGPQEFWTTPIGQFERHLRWFRDEGIPVITLDDIAGYAQRGESVPDRAVVITIDDADRSVYELVWPVLERWQLKVHLFVPTGHVGAPWSGIDVCTWDELSEMAASGLVVLGSHTHDLHFKVMTDRGRQPVFWNPETIDAEQAAGTARALRNLAHRADDPVTTDTGNPILDDLDLSRRLIEQHGGATCRWLAWPYGFGNGALDSLAAVAGYDGTLSLRPTAVDESTPNWHLGRFTLTAKTTPADIADLFASHGNE